MQTTIRTVKETDGTVKTFNTDKEFLEYVRGVYKKNEEGQPYESEIHWLPENIQQATEYIVEYCPELELTEGEAIVESKKTQPTPFTGGEPRFDTQDLDEGINIPDLQKWVDERKLDGLIDEEKGGIIGYINHEHINEIAAMLNEHKNMYEALNGALKILNREGLHGNVTEFMQAILNRINNK